MFYSKIKWYKDVRVACTPRRKIIATKLFSFSMVFEVISIKRNEPWAGRNARPCWCQIQTPQEAVSSQTLKKVRNQTTQLWFGLISHDFMFEDYKINIQPIHLDKDTKER
jgi:hypothetical protein